MVAPCSQPRAALQSLHCAALPQPLSVGRQDSPLGSDQLEGSSTRRHEVVVVLYKVYTVVE